MYSYIYSYIEKSSSSHACQKGDICAFDVRDY